MPLFGILSGSGQTEFGLAGGCLIDTEIRARLSARDEGTNNEPG
jgi:hypothetical protein